MAIKDFISGMNLTRKILFLALIPLVFGGGAVLYVGFNFATHALTEESENLSRLQADIHSQAIRDYLKTHIDTMTTLAASRSLHGGRLSEIIPQLRQWGETMEDIEYLYYDELDGTVHGTDGKSFSVSDRYYFPSVQRGEIVVSKPLVSRDTGEAIVLLLVPIYDENKRHIGALGGTIRIAKLIERVNRIRIGSTGFAMLLDDEGNMICGEQGVNVTWEKIKATLLKAISQANSTPVPLVINNESCTLYSREIPPTKWKLAVVSKRSEALRKVYHSVIATVAMLVGTIMLALFLAFVLRRIILTPIKRLMDVQQKITAGDLCARTVVSSRDELGMLALSFNQMADTIMSVNQHIQHSEAVLSSIFNVAPVGIGMATLDRKIIDINNGAELIFGFSKKELIGSDIRILYANDDEYERNNTLLYTDLMQKGKTTAEALMCNKHGSMLNGLISIALLNPQNPSDGVVFIIMDITEQKRAEESLRNSQQILSQILDAVPQSIFWKDKNGVYIGCNKVFRQAVGIGTPDAIAGKTDFDLPWPKEEAEAYRADDHEVITNNRPKLHIIEPLQQADGTRLWIDTSKMPLTDANGNVYGVLGVYEDITERKRVEEVVRANEARFRAILENSQVALYKRDYISNTYEYMSPVIKNITGYTSEELMYMSVDEVNALINPDDVHAIQQALGTAVANGGGKVHFEYRFTHKNGKIRWVSDVGEMTLDSNGTPIYCMGSVQDITDRKRAEKELQDENKLFIAGPVVVFKWLSASGWPVEYVSPNITAQFGYKPEDFLSGRFPYASIVHPDDLQRIGDEVVAHSNEGVPFFEQEYRIARADGNYRWLYDYTTVVRDRSGKITHYLGYIIDITESKRAAEALKESEERLKDIANKVPGVVYQFFAKDNGEWGLYFVSERSEDIFGVKAEPLETYFTRFLECVAEEDKERFITSIKEAISSESSWDFEGKLITPTAKEEKYVRGASVSKRQKGEIVFNGILLDITERRHIEDALRKSEAHFKAILENSQVALYQRNYTTNTYDYMSPVIKNISGYSSEELCKMSVEEVNALTNPDDVHVCQEAISTAIANGGGKIQVEYRFTHKSGQMKWVSDIAGIYLDSNGKPLYAIGSVQDITTRKKSEDELGKYRNHLEELVKERTTELNVINQEMEAFSYTVSHDLRAPLRHIDGFMEMLQDMTEGKLDEQCRRYMHNILDSTNKMGTLIDDLLAFSRLGRYGMNIHPVDMDDITHDVIKEFSQDIKGRHISWRIAEMPTVMGDQSLLRTVMVNLVSNAIKFTRHREQAEIEIGYRSEDAEIVIFVRDNGVGFDPNYMDNLFGVFQRLHRDDEFEGNGVGLANVRRIISKHGGRTWAEGALDKGATFYFSLPKEH
ncbi:MAG: PAS domain S-box protein [Spirochaetes bacterium]|nr:PAS domain S-box protein [Spirochaetota bacterium]